MNAVVFPKKLNGTVAAPPSKSCAHRLLIAAALADRSTTLTGLPLNAAGTDVNATVAALTTLGARFTQDGASVQVEPIDTTALTESNAASLTEPQTINGIDSLNCINCLDSGSTLRFMLPVAAALGAPVRFTGEGRLPERPIAPLTDQLSVHGAVFTTESPVKSSAAVKLPFTVSGPLHGGLWKLPGDVSSQFVSGLLFALPMLTEDSRIELTGPLESSGYVDLTITSLETFGIKVVKEAGGFSVPGGQRYRAPDSPVAVEGDWSGAAFWYGANALGSNITITGLKQNSWQPDRAIPALIDALILGATTLDLSNTPDLTPIMAVVAVGLHKPVRLEGISRLRLKESDRVKTISDGLNDMGVPVIALPDALIIPHSNGFRGGSIHSQEDHRIAMAFAIAGTAADRSLAVIRAECVDKSYSTFWEDLDKLGAKTRYLSFAIDPNYVPGPEDAFEYEFVPFETK